MIRYLAPLLIAAVAAPVLASPEEPPQTARVVYHDLDLSRGEGRATLDRRLRVAVKRVCPYRHDGTFTGRYARRACYRATLRSAREFAAAATLSQKVQLASARRAEAR